MKTIPCQGCGKRLRVEPNVKKSLCRACTKRLGVEHPQSGERLPPTPCRRCHHRVLVRCAIRDRATDRTVAPFAATFAVLLRTSFDASVDTKEPIGMFEAFICRACGYTEWFCHRPEDIPIGIEYGTELVTLPDEGPYRR